MDPTFLLAIALLSLAAGWLLAMHVKDRAYYDMMRRDVRTIAGLRGELQRHIDLYRAEKKRADGLLGEVRRQRRAGWRAMNKYGPSVFSDPSLLAAHKQIESARKLIDSLNEKYGLTQPLGHLPPLAKAVCWRCGEPATTRLGDSMYCEDCVGAR